jgi:transposase
MEVESRPDTMSNICSYYKVSADVFRKHYKKRASGFEEWDQLNHCQDYLLFPENIGEYLSIDEVSLSKGELYTFITNKAAGGKKGTIVACISGTKSEDITKVLKRIVPSSRKIVKEITLDMANNMASAVKEAFPMATLVTDRFHVVRLAQNAMQAVRIKLGWEELQKENLKITQAKQNKEKYNPKVLRNDDTPRQLLTRCRYVFAKKESQWTENQKERAEIAFETYPELKLAYYHTIRFRACYEKKNKIDAMVAFKEWIDDTFKLKLENFNTVANTVENHFDNILNFFNNYNTNANAESFNSKIKLFRANLRGVVDTKFFLFRLMKLFA